MKHPSLGMNHPRLPCNHDQPVTKMWLVCGGWDKRAKVSGRRFENVPEASILGAGAYGKVWRASDRAARERY